jgi:hypothetical protein
MELLNTWLPVEDSNIADKGNSQRLCLRIVGRFTILHPCPFMSLEVGGTGKVVGFPEQFNCWSCSTVCDPDEIASNDHTDKYLSALPLIKPSCDKSVTVCFSVYF